MSNVQTYVEIYIYVGFGNVHIQVWHIMLRINKHLNICLQQVKRSWKYIYGQTLKTQHLDCNSFIIFMRGNNAPRKLLPIKVTPDLHLTYSKNGGNLGLVLKMKNIACISILLTKHVFLQKY